MEQEKTCVQKGKKTKQREQSERGKKKKVDEKKRR